MTHPTEAEFEAVSRGISDGLNALHAIANGDPADPSDLAALAAALEAVRAGRVATSWTVTSEHVNSARRVRALASAGSDDAAGEAEALYNALAASG